jgi:hypothetical protein
MSLEPAVFVGVRGTKSVFLEPLLQIGGATSEGAGRLAALAT